MSLCWHLCCVSLLSMQSKCDISRATFSKLLKSLLLHQLQVSSIELSLLAEFCHVEETYFLFNSQENAPKYKISNSFCHIIVTLRDLSDMDTIIKSHVRFQKEESPLCDIYNWKKAFTCPTLPQTKKIPNTIQILEKPYYCIEPSLPLLSLPLVQYSTTVTRFFSVSTCRGVLPKNLRGGRTLWSRFGVQHPPNLGLSLFRGF